MSLNVVWSSSANAFNYIIQGLMGLGLIVGVAALGVISARSVVERRQEIGVMRAIGFQARLVQFSFIAESTFVVVLGILLGLGLGLAIAFNVIRDAGQSSSWDNLRFTVPWLNLLVIFAVANAAALLMTLLPARRSSRVYPATALRYE